jgi:hypothetical protein
MNDHRCEGCPIPADHACHALVAGLYHWCLQRAHDPAMDAYLVAHSHPGPEPDRRSPAPPEATAARRAAKPRISLGVDQKAMAKD